MRPLNLLAISIKKKMFYLQKEMLWIAQLSSFGRGNVTSNFFVKRIHFLICFFLLFSKAERCKIH